MSPVKFNLHDIMKESLTHSSIHMLFFFLFLQLGMNATVAYLVITVSAINCII